MTTQASSAAPSQSALGTARALWRSLRPHQWVKNLLVFGALIFSRSLTHSDAVLKALAAFVAFCLVSSGIYLLNDLCDLEEDRRHPKKRSRPLASGELARPPAVGALLALLTVGTLLAVAVKPALGVVLGLYLAMHAGYSLGLKHVAILDVMLIALGFVLRAVGGAVAIGVEATPWLMLCTLLLALLLGFGKRRQEITMLEEAAVGVRRSLRDYSAASLDHMMAIAAGSAIVTYSLYTLSEATAGRFGTHGLVLTVPSVIYGILRYLYLVQEEQLGDDPARLLVTDRPLLVNSVLWISLVAVIVYLRPAWLPW